MAIGQWLLYGLPLFCRGLLHRHTSIGSTSGCGCLRAGHRFTAKRAGPLFSLVLASGFVFVTARTSDAQNTPVRLQVQSRSWVQGSSFDVDRFTALCADAGIDLVPPSAATAATATAVVTYAEEKGAGFSMFGVPPPVGYGTKITFKLTLLAAGNAKTLASLTSQVETPAGLPKEMFHQGAVDAFRSTPAYHLSCSVIAGALGSQQQLRKLLPWALVDRQALSLLDTLGFRPESPIERAYLAAGKADFAALRSLGDAAADPLLLLFQNSASDRDGIGMFPAVEPQRARTLSRALTILAPLRDERVPEVLAGFLNDYSEFRDGRDPTVSAVPKDVIRLLATAGDVFTLPLLDEWKAGDSPLAGEARTASDTLRKRLTIE